MVILTDGVPDDKELVGNLTDEKQQANAIIFKLPGALKKIFANSEIFLSVVGFRLDELDETTERRIVKPFQKAVEEELEPPGLFKPVTHVKELEDFLTQSLEWKYELGEASRRGGRPAKGKPPGRHRQSARQMDLLASFQGCAAARL